jgi:hypothetical protein
MKMKWQTCLLLLGLCIVKIESFEFENVDENIGENVDENVGENVDENVDQNVSENVGSSLLASMTWTHDDGFVVVDGKLTTSVETVAWINFTNAINETGWSYLEIKTDHRFPDKIQVKETEGFSTTYWFKNIKLHRDVIIVTLLFVKQ